MLKGAKLRFFKCYEKFTLMIFFFFLHNLMFNLTLAYRLQIYLVEFFWKRWPKMRFFWYLVSAWSISDFLHEAAVAWRIKNDFNDFWEKLCSEDFGPKMSFAKNQCMELLWFFCMKLQQYKVLKLTKMVFCKKSFTRVFGQKGAQNELREFYKKIVPLSFFDFFEFFWFYRI